LAYIISNRFTQTSMPSVNMPCNIPVSWRKTFGS
jgi:hypothetical protein